jgi:hypothetical protein
MEKKERVANNSDVEEHSSPAWARSFIDGMAFSNCISKMAIQLEIPGLCSAKGLKTCPSRKAKPRTKRKSSTSHKQSNVIDPRQLQLAFAEA